MAATKLGTVAQKNTLESIALKGDLFFTTDLVAIWIAKVDGAYTLAHGVDKTGTYTGDGTTSQGITGVLFAPKYVRIWNRETVDGTAIEAFETSADMVDDIAAGAAYDVKNAVIKDNAIISLDADGFTVDDDGLDSHPNKSGQVYNYIAHG